MTHDDLLPDSLEGDNSPVNPVPDYLERSLDALEFPRICAELIRLAETEPAREELSGLKPSQDLEWIRRELKSVDEIKSLIERGITLSFSGLVDLRPILQRARIPGSVLSVEELLAVLFHLRVHLNIRKILDRESDQIRLIYKRTRSLKALTQLISAIDQIVAPEGLVRDRASKELSRIRHQLSALQVDIRKRIGSMASRLASQGILQGESYTLRDGRYVLPLKSESFRKVKGIVHDRSSTGGTTYVEPSAVVDLGNEYRELELAERDEIRRILREISTRVRSDLSSINTNLNMLTLLDCLWAKARLAEILDAYPPQIQRSGPLRIIQGRHPLLVLGGERKVVPLRLDLGVDYTCLVISGPNAGGKSVALKCVGLFCVMAACGLHLPALPGLEIPLFDDFFAVIGDQQSLTDDLSTFTAHTTRLKEIILYATPQSLVLVDEIGAGTDPHEGASLSIAALEKLAQRKVPTIVTTHHGALKAFAHSTEGCANGSMAFDTESFQPTYIFHPNLPGSSYALDIARRVGLPQSIISRAREILGEDQNRLEDLLADLTAKVQKYEVLVTGQEKVGANFENLEQTYQRKLAGIQEREKQAKRAAREGVREVIAEGRRQIEAVVKEIRENNASREAIKKAHAGLQKLNKLADKPPKKQTSAEPQPVKKPSSKRSKSSASSESKTPARLVDRTKKPEVGDWVEIDESQTRGEITTLSSRGDRACVVIGSVQLWINVDRLSVTNPPQPEQVKTFIKPKADVPLELDLRGLDANEAVDRVERYLYDGLNSGREQLGIIHGKGHGILSRAVREYLKKHNLVESYRFGEHGEGDYGVTIVTLKKN